MKIIQIIYSTIVLLRFSSVIRTLYVDWHSNACHFVKILLKIFAVDLCSAQEQILLLHFSQILFIYKLPNALDKFAI